MHSQSDLENQCLLYHLVFLDDFILSRSRNVVYFNSGGFLIGVGEEGGPADCNHIQE